MNETMALPREMVAPDSLADDLWGIVLGVAFTFALFASIARFENAEKAEPPAEIEDLRVMSIPLDAPPPKVVQTEEVFAPPMPLAGIEVAASDSPVKITVLAPDLSALPPDVQFAPSATIQPAML